MILDIHSHRFAPYPQGVISMRSFIEPPVADQLYSVGIHPWDSNEGADDSTFAQLEQLARLPNVVAIGECGVDPGKGAPMFRQLQILKRQIDLSEKLKKPLILHCVKSADIILGLKKDLNPSQVWVIHGFRGKPQLASQLTSKGICLSFGEKFNAETVMQMPADMLFAETDESVLSINEIIGNLSEAANRDLMPEIEANVSALFKI